MERVREFLRYPLVHLGGGELTAGSLVTGIVVLAAAVALSALAQRAVGRILRARGLTRGVQAAVGKVVRYAVVVVGTAVALGTMGLDLTAILAASTVLLVGLGFGLQNIAQNFVSGLILLIEQPIRQGDFVRVGDTFGVVDDIGLRATRVITRDSVAIIVPNSDLVTTPVVNHSRPTSNLRIEVRVGVAYGSDVPLVRETLLAAARAHPRVLAEPPPEVRFLDFGDSSLDFALLSWIAEPQQDLRMASELRFAIDGAFRRAGISIPFPQRDVHLRSGLEALRPRGDGEAAGGQVIR